jgi:hypothetical protein
MKKHPLNKLIKELENAIVQNELSSNQYNILFEISEVLDELKRNTPDGFASSPAYSSGAVGQEALS